MQRWVNSKSCVLGALVALCGALAAVSQAAERTPTFNRRTGLFEPPLSALRAAEDRDDHADVARWADRIGAARLASACKGGVREDVLVALPGAAALAGGVRLLEAVTPLLDSPDAEIVQQATRTIATLLDGTQPGAIQDWEIAPDIIKRACTSLDQMTRRTDTPPGPRLAALDALADSTLYCDNPATLLALLRDPAPALRRAAALALPARAPAQVAALREHLTDEDPAVAAAAAVGLCRARLTMAATAGIPANEAATLRALIQADATPVEDAVELVPCLAAVGTEAERKVLEQLRRGRISPLQRRAHEAVEGLR